MATVAAIDADLLNLLSETAADTHFSDSAERYGYISRAQEIAAIKCEWPRDHAEVSITTDVGAYTLPSDFLLLRAVYIDNVGTGTGKRKLEVTKTEVIGALHGGWLDESVDSTKGDPRLAFLYDKATLYIFPRPNSAYSGKKVTIEYVYQPTELTLSTQTPDLPTPYHNILKFYAAYLCYLKLKNPEMAARMLTDFAEHFKAEENTVTKESEGAFKFSWGDLY